MHGFDGQRKACCKIIQCNRAFMLRQQMWYRRKCHWKDRFLLLSQRSFAVSANTGILLRHAFTCNLPHCKSGRYRVIPWCRNTEKLRLFLTKDFRQLDKNTHSLCLSIMLCESTTCGRRWRTSHIRFTSQVKSPFITTATSTASHVY